MAQVMQGYRRYVIKIAPKDMRKWLKPQLITRQDANDSKYSFAAVEHEDGTVSSLEANLTLSQSPNEPIVILTFYGTEFNSIEMLVKLTFNYEIRIIQ